MSRNNFPKRHIIVLIALALTLMLGVLFGETTYADDSVEPLGVGLNENNFPDDQFRKILSDKKYDKNQDGFFDEYEISNLTNLKVWGIYSLEGIQYLTDIENLDIYNFNGSDNTGYGGSVFDLSNNKKIKILSIEKVPYLTQIDLSANTELVSLSLTSTELTDLDLSGNVNLEYLTLDKCKKILKLDLDNNPELVQLKLEQSKIENLNLRDKTKLTTLSVTDEMASDQYAGVIPLNNVDLRGCCSLETLIINNSNVNWLYLCDCYKLKYVKASACKLEYVNAAGVDTLEYFDGGSNKNLKEAYFTGCSNLTDLTLNGVALEKFDLTGCSSLRNLHASGLQMETLDLTDCAALYQLYLTSSRIRSIDISGCPELYEVILDENDLQGLDVSHNPKLNRLDIKNQSVVDMKIGALDLSGCPELKSLDCFNAKVTSLNLSGCSELETLRAGENMLTELDLSNSPDLKELYVIRNKITELDISNCPGLCTCIKNGTDSYAYDEFWDFRSFEYVDHDTWERYVLAFDDKTLLIYDEGTYTAPKKSLAGAEIKLSAASYVYNGKSRKPAVRVYRNGNEVSADCYDVSYRNNVNVGTATVIVTGKGNYEGSARTTFKITQATNSFTASGKTITAKYTKLKKGSVTFLRKNIISYRNKKGTLTYTKTSGNSKITVNKTTGKMKIAKGLKKGTYKVKVKVKDAGTKNYKAKTVTVTVTVKVK